MNILFVAIDTLRPDRLECYGYHRKTSPTLAALAREGIVCENCFAGTMPTSPSFTSIFTGLDAYAHQIVGVGGKQTLDKGIKTFVEYLKKKGYYTCCVDNLAGGGHGGDHYRRGYDKYVPLNMAANREKWEKRNAEDVTAKGLRLLKELPKDKPFYMFLHYWDPHTPYWPPDKFHKMHYKGNEKDPRNLSMKKVYAFEGFGYGFVGENITDIDYVCAEYDAEISYNSHHLGRVFRKMKQMGLWDDALVIVYSDHGEVLDKHEGFFDHHGLYDDNIRIPLIIKLPKARHAGARVEPFTQNYDIPVTLLELAGIRKPRQMVGRNVLDLVTGKAREFYKEIYLGEATWQVKRGIRTKEWKFIRACSNSPYHNWHGGGVRELYNLVADPEEQSNIVQLRPRVARELERRLDDWLRMMKKKYGHDDPVPRQGPTLSRKKIRELRRKDMASSDPIL